MQNLIKYFSVQNGISRLLYTIYVDDLIQRLEKEGIGCYIASKYYGGICYADDLQMVCPSVCGLQRMVDMCVENRVEYDIKYNE